MTDEADRNAAVASLDRLGVADLAATRVLLARAQANRWWSVAR